MYPLFSPPFFLQSPSQQHHHCQYHQHSRRTGFFKSYTYAISQADSHCYSHHSSHILNPSDCFHIIAY
nr:MAG TPA: hypothetical protein [Caudoviricetes sp.]